MEQLVDVQPYGERLLAVQTKVKSGELSRSPALFNPFLASLVTSHARQYMLTHLRRLGPFSLYTDTGFFSLFWPFVPCKC